MQQQDVERIAKAAMRDLGVPGAVLTVQADASAGHWRIDIKGGHGPGRITIRCGEGSSPQWVRSQIVEQYNAG